MTAPDYGGRLERLRQKLASARLDALLVWPGVNVEYLSGFAGGECPLLVGMKRADLVVDPRYRLQAEADLPSQIRVCRRLSTLGRTLALLARRSGWQRIGFEERVIPWAVGHSLRTELSARELLPAGGVVEDLRLVKDESEIARLRWSSEQTVQVLEGRRGDLRVGAVESALARQLQIDFLARGGEAAFPPIVAIGSRSSRPHALAADVSVGRGGGIVLMDLGGRWLGYASDLTRTMVVGKFPSWFATIYRAVLEAQRQALAKIRPGVQAAAIDQAARSVLARAGLEKYFTHGLGHGVGLEVHERPALNRRSREVLEAGMIITVEPGVYLNKWGGVRIEDTVLVTADGVEILTETPRDLESMLLPG